MTEKCLSFKKVAEPTHAENNRGPEAGVTVPNVFIIRTIKRSTVC